MQTNQTPEALAEDILCLNANGMDWTEELMRLRDMAASGAKDAEALNWLEKQFVVVSGQFNSEPGKLRHCIDAAIAATKRGGA